jgi:hypothetical protein
MNFTIKGTKTSRNDAPLCFTCQHGMIVRGQAESQLAITCHVGMEPVSVRWHVTECSSYSDKSLPSLHSLEKIAWRFSVDDRKKTAGFLTAAQWKAAHPNDESDY